MKNNKGNRGLVCSALLASVCAGAATQSALADPTVIDILAAQTSAAAWNDPNGPYVFDAIIGQHQFGAYEYIDSYFFPGFGYTVAVGSGVSYRPGWEYELTMNWAAFGIQYGLPGADRMYMYFGIKDPNGPNPITSYNVKDRFGNPFVFTDLGSDGGTIAFSMSAADLNAASNIVTIQWNQDIVPAPGALAVLGMAGLVGSRRRRR